MNQIQILAGELRHRFPISSIILTEPLRSNDTWTLDLRQHPKWLVITWMTPDYFTVSEVTENTVYGDGPDFICASVTASLARVIELIQSQPASRSSVLPTP